MTTREPTVSTVEGGSATAGGDAPPDETRTDESDASTGADGTPTDEDEAATPVPRVDAAESAAALLVYGVSNRE
ncbi:hypothetical protein SAMN04487947_0371 [Halogeometricum rufum]|uniref:Uncharacterized protein n=1 Tax=Halogeometricum rufum TaxID=553469 RepID=A0A1I6G0X6_9EURY|nr:hypothetical protein [Halogeometricum rufum]SFR35790.1 hypothetical protein SAMN04487947_0371 [Halogeometricum rufum]